MPFTREELAAMAAADREIEENFCLDPEDMALSRELDLAAKLEAMTGDKRKVAARKKAYREARKRKNLSALSIGRSEGKA